MIGFDGRIERGRLRRGFHTQFSREQAATDLIVGQGFAAPATQRQQAHHAAMAFLAQPIQVEQALGERMAIMNDLQNLVAASPAVIYTTQASGDYACTFVGENLKSTMGYAPWEMREDTRFWSKRLHPEDAPRVFAEISTLIERGAGTIEYRFRHRRGHYIWLQDTFKVIEGKNGKELVGSWADISDRKKIEAEVQRLAKEVELRNSFIRDTFGRYLTDEVVTTLLDSPTGLQMGGDKRKVTMVMADLRGFTSLSERLAPKWVVTILNRYPDRFLFGTDTVAPAGPEPYYAVFDMWAPVWKQLTPEASLKVRKTNYERLFDEGRRRVRAWERANVR